MLCTCPSRKNALNYQPIPKMNCNYDRNSIITLLNATDTSAPIYYYVMSSVRSHNNTLQHIGSGPNWQGGVITLCTCKHLMRTYPYCKQGTWIAGFSNFKAGEGNNSLIYLMRVGQTYKSHCALWHSLPEEIREAKASDMNPLGDVYRPLGREIQESPFDPAMYRKPCRNHSHERGWSKDIKYKAKKGIHPLLLVGDVKYSFVWNQCMITLGHSIGRGQRRLNLCEFITCLRDADSRNQ
jgi:hypothetical protein